MGVNTGNNDANGSNTGSGSGGSDRRRRSGVTAVMQRPGTVDYDFLVFIYTSMHFIICSISLQQKFIMICYIN